MTAASSNATAARQLQADARRPGRSHRRPGLVLGGLVAAVISTFALLGVTAHPASAAGPLRSAPGDELRIVDVDTTSFPMVSATVAVPERARPDSDLSSKLTASSAGRPLPAEVERLSAGTQPIALLIDDASDTGAPTLSVEQGAASEFLRQLDRQSPVILATSTRGLVFGPSADRAEALAALGRLQPGGTRNWSDALAATLDAAAGAPQATVVVVSTGPSGPTGPTDGAPSDLPGRLAGDGITVRWLSLANDAGPTGSLAGIQSVTSTTAEGVLARLDSIAADLVGQYRLTFQVDPRASAAAVTLVLGDQTWTAETPLPLPGPAYVAPSAQAADVASAVSPVATQPASPAQRAGTFVTANSSVLIVALMALLLLGAAVRAVRASPAGRPSGERP